MVSLTAIQHPSHGNKCSIEGNFDAIADDVELHLSSDDDESDAEATYHAFLSLTDVWSNDVARIMTAPAGMQLLVTEDKRRFILQPPSLETAREHLALTAASPMTTISRPLVTQLRGSETSTLSDPASLSRPATTLDAPSHFSALAAIYNPPSLAEIDCYVFQTPLDIFHFEATKRLILQTASQSYMLNYDGEPEEQTTAFTNVVVEK